MEVKTLFLIVVFIIGLFSFVSGIVGYTSYETCAIGEAGCSVQPGTHQEIIEHGGLFGLFPYNTTETRENSGSGWVAVRKNDVPIAVFGLGLMVLSGWFLKKSTKKVKKVEKKENEELEKVKETIYMRCPKCKAKNEEDADFCKKCGNKL